MATNDSKYPEPRYCEKCGTRTEWLMRDDEVAVETCPCCGHRMYRNSKPCAGALIVDEGKLLLIKRGIEPYINYWDIPGGFLHEREHPREGAVREAKEETGLDIEPVEILGIFIDRYSNQGYNHNTYFVANNLGGELQPDDDAIDAKWFPINDLPDKIAFPNHAREVLRLLIEKFEGRKI